MTTYIVFEHKALGRKAVKNGFSLGGGFITLLWALYHKMWLLSVVLFIWASIAWNMNDILSNVNKGDLFGYMLAQFIFYHLPVLFIFGFGGNGILQSRLKNQGYERVEEYVAFSPEDALAKAASKSPSPVTAMHQAEKIQQLPAYDLAAQLSNLNDLRERGALSEEEYQIAKTKLLQS